MCAYICVREVTMYVCEVTLHYGLSGHQGNLDLEMLVFCITESRGSQGYILSTDLVVGNCLAIVLGFVS